MGMIQVIINNMFELKHEQYRAEETFHYRSKSLRRMLLDALNGGIIRTMNQDKVK